MTFLRPEYLWLAPLLAVPIIIHLLNRIRYRRVKWAAMQFLLSTERRAVRRAKLRQWVLMALRTAVLAAALLALLQPVLRGQLGALLGAGSRLVVVLDDSASMAAGDVVGSAFERARNSAAELFDALPRSGSAAIVTTAPQPRAPFAQPVQNSSALSAALEQIERSGGGGDMPAAIERAAKLLGDAGGGGALWLVTDLRASDWRVSDEGAWADVRAALRSAGQPRLLITDVAPPLELNLAIAEVHVSPEVLLPGDAPRITAAVERHGNVETDVAVSLILDGQLLETQRLAINDVSQEVAFQLPPLSGEAGSAHTVEIHLSGDGQSSDDRHFLLLEPGKPRPVLIVEAGSAEAASFDRAGDFLALALAPPAAEAHARSRFAPRRATGDELANLTLADFAAVCILDPAAIEPEQAERLETFVRDGGLLLIFPGDSASTTGWSRLAFHDVAIDRWVALEGEEHAKVASVSAASPVTATLASEGLDRVKVFRYARLDSGEAQVLASFENGAPFLVRQQVGRGRVYVFAVNCNTAASNLPLTPVLLVTLHRAILGHLAERGGGHSQRVGEPIRLTPESASGCTLVRPDGTPLERRDAQRSGELMLIGDAGEPGFYRLQCPGSDAAAVARPVAALNVPIEESRLERVSPDQVRRLLDGSDVSIVEAGSAGAAGASGALGAAGDTAAASAFPWAVLAFVLLLGEALLAWSLGPAPGSRAAPGSRTVPGSRTAPGSRAATQKPQAAA